MAEINNSVMTSENNKYAKDFLTGLLSMHHFFELTNQKKREVIRDNAYSDYVLLYANLVDFKIVNSVYGVSRGDELLIEIARILQEEFEDSYVARFSADIFAVFTCSADVETKITRAHDQVKKLSERLDLELKFGIRRFDKNDDNTEASVAFDQAQIACLSIKRDVNLYCAEFDEELRFNMLRKAYIVSHIDNAIENGYIQVYYQPIIRAYTGRLCGMEALSRWVDPEYGFLSPAQFIPVLEEARLIHKLDNFIIDQVARDLREQMDKNMPVVPVSLNVSRMDFLEGHTYEALEKVIKQYNLRSDLICVEITESTLMHDKQMMIDEIDGLHRCGFEVWMDDFGSGYSSLNILKEFKFDEIKIDMLFLRNLNESGKEILKSMISMAKRLGIHTEAEGAETEEQVELLRNIGCEKIQGFYYGKPMPLKDMLQHCRDFGIEHENVQEKYIFDRAGLVDMNVTSPVALFWDNGETFKLLGLNETYLENLIATGTEGAKALQERVSSGPSYLMNKIRDFLQKAINSGEIESLNYVDNGKYIKLNAQTVAGLDGTYIHKIEYYNISSEDETEKAKTFDILFRNAIVIYSDIYLYYPENDTLQVIETSNKYQGANRVLSNAARYFEYYRDEFVYQDDKRYFEEFIDADRIYQEAARNGHDFVAQTLRIRQNDGNYCWVNALALVNTKMPGNPILFLIRESYFNREEFRGTLIDRLSKTNDIYRYNKQGEKWAIDGELWRNLMANTFVCYFWKDKERRFMGASKAFLEAFGIKDVSEIIGKTDEDMGWHIDDQPYRSDEELVLKGEKVIDSVGHCIIRGQNRVISANKFPIYQDGEIIGLLGFFNDVERDNKKYEHWHDINYQDLTSGCMNFKGLTDAAIKYDDNYRKNHEDYIGVAIDIPEYDYVLEKFGEKIANKLLRKIAKLIKYNSSLEAVLARLSGARFVILDKINDIATVRARAYECERQIHELHEIDGCQFTLFMHYTLIWRSEVSSAETMFSALTQRLANVEKSSYTGEILAPERIELGLEKFESMDQSVYICDPETYELHYMNRGCLLGLGLDTNYPYKGKKCYNVIMGYDKPCANCPNAHLRNDSFYEWKTHNSLNGKDYLLHDTLIQWGDTTAKFSTGIVLNDYHKELEDGQQFIYREMAINDALAVALREDTPEQGLIKLLENIGKGFQAERVYICEDEGDRIVSNTYEWCGEGFDSLQDEIQHKSAEWTGFYDKFDQNQPVVIKDVEEIRDSNPVFYETLREQKIRSIIAVLLKSGDQEIGYLGVDNPRFSNEKAISLMLETLAQYVVFMLRDRDNNRKLERMSLRDNLTGAMNRRALKMAVRAMATDQNYAVIYADVNGLKHTNDTLGHEAGDKLIMTATAAMIKVLGQRNVFRLGGDEFILIAEIPDESSADTILTKLRGELQEHDVSMALGCVTMKGGKADLEEILSEADRRMYLNKQYMHQYDI